MMLWQTGQTLAERKVHHLFDLWDKVRLFFLRSSGVSSDQRISDAPITAIFFKHHMGLL